MKKTICTISGLMMLAIASHAQTNDVSVSFETNDYKNIGVYDTWEHSPFRSQQGATPQLAGNVNVVDNIDTAYDEVLKTKPDSTLKVLGFQRSRFGSNTFGARIDLNKTFELTTTTKYVHVMNGMKDMPAQAPMQQVAPPQDGPTPAQMAAPQTAICCCSARTVWSWRRQMRRSAAPFAAQMT